MEVGFDLSGIDGEDRKGDGPAAAIYCTTLLCYFEISQPTKLDACLGKLSINNISRLSESKICGSLRILFSPFVARLLVNLQQLYVYRCDAMVAIIAWEQEEEDDGVRIDTIIFRQLSYLRLQNLTSFCPQAFTFQGSFLKQVRIANCLVMKLLPSAVQRAINEQGSFPNDEVEFDFGIDEALDDFSHLFATLNAFVVSCTNTTADTTPSTTPRVRAFDDDNDNDGRVRWMLSEHFERSYQLLQLKRVWWF